jgi:hypothetical protein
LTAFSSQKIALYFREGVPIISSDNESYQKLYRDFKCGRSIFSYDDVVEAAHDIIKHHEVYAEEARRAFDTDYANEISMPRLGRFLSELEQRRCDSSPR